MRCIERKFPLIQKLQQYVSEILCNLWILLRESFTNRAALSLITSWYFCQNSLQNLNFVSVGGSSAVLQCCFQTYQQYQIYTLFDRLPYLLQIQYLSLPYGRLFVVVSENIWSYYLKHMTTQQACEIKFFRKFTQLFSKITWPERAHQS